jgi:Ca-activated chloride channel family protein
MKWIRYSRYTGDDFGLSAEDLLKALSDFFLQSGFQNQYMGFSEWNKPLTLIRRSATNTRSKT